MRNKGRKIYYYEHQDEHDSNKQRWGLTDDKTKARSMDNSYRLANLIDLNDWISATEEIFDGIIEVEEGLYQWYEREYYEDGLWDCKCDYVPV